MSIEKYFDEMEKIQEEKCILADKAKELVPLPSPREKHLVLIQR
jgi:hypothetical protein